MLEAAFAEEGKGVVVTLTDRDSTPTLLKTMAIKYRGAFTFVEVPPSEEAFLGKFGLEKEDLAQLFVLPASKVRAWTWGGRTWWSRPVDARLACPPLVTLSSIPRMHTRAPRPSSWTRSTSRRR